MSKDYSIVDSKQASQSIDTQFANHYRASKVFGKRTLGSEPMDNNEFNMAIKRLAKNLSSGASLRHDVPRGYYLNVRI